MKGNSLDQRSSPPAVLVKTWIHLINSSESDEVKNRASSMLLNSFCNIQEAAEFCRKHDVEM